MTAILLVISAYVASQILADIASLKIALVMGMSIDAGTFIYPITFTLRDLVHKTIGIRSARALIFIAAVINVFMALFFWFTARLPSDLSVGPQMEYGIVLSPVWRIVFASIVAEVSSELMDTEVYRMWIEFITKQYQWMRVLVSNSVSIPLDSLIFCWLAFGGIMPNIVVWSIIMSNIIIKGLTTLLSLPLIYIVPEKEGSNAC